MKWRTIPAAALVAALSGAGARGQSKDDAAQVKSPASPVDAPISQTGVVEPLAGTFASGPLGTRVHLEIDSYWDCHATPVPLTLLGDAALSKGGADAGMRSDLAFQLRRVVLTPILLGVASSDHSGNHVRGKLTGVRGTWKLFAVPLVKGQNFCGDARSTYRPDVNEAGVMADCDHPDRDDWSGAAAIGRHF